MLHDPFRNLKGEKVIIEAIDNHNILIINGD